MFVAALAVRDRAARPSACATTARCRGSKPLCRSGRTPGPHEIAGSRPVLVELCAQRHLQPQSAVVGEDTRVLVVATLALAARDGSQEVTQAMTLCSRNASSGHESIAAPSLVRRPRATTPCATSCATRSTATARRHRTCSTARSPGADAVPLPLSALDTYQYRPTCRIPETEPDKSDVQFRILAARERRCDDLSVLLAAPKHQHRGRLAGRGAGHLFMMMFHLGEKKPTAG